MGDEEDEKQPTIEEKLDLLIARQDDIARELSTEHILDADLKRLLKVVLYLVILTLVFYIVKSLLTPILAYL